MAAKKDDAKKNPHAKALGALGGKVGGPARAKALKPEVRTKIAKHAAEVRWHGGQSKPKK